MNAITLDDRDLPDSHGRFCVNHLHLMAAATGANKRSPESRRLSLRPAMQAAMNILRHHPSAGQVLHRRHLTAANPLTAH